MLTPLRLPPWHHPYAWVCLPLDMMAYRWKMSHLHSRNSPDHPQQADQLGNQPTPHPPPPQPAQATWHLAKAATHLPSECKSHAHAYPAPWNPKYSTIPLSLQQMAPDVGPQGRKRGKDGLGCSVEFPGGNRGGMLLAASVTVPQEPRLARLLKRVGQLLQRCWQLRRRKGGLRRRGCSLGSWQGSWRSGDWRLPVAERQQKRKCKQLRHE